MSIHSPWEEGSSAEPDQDVERDEAPFPTRFGRDKRRRRPLRRTRSEGEVPRDDERPFDDDGGL